MDGSAIKAEEKCALRGRERFFFENTERVLSFIKVYRALHPRFYIELYYDIVFLSDILSNNFLASTTFPHQI
jgi:hypothetical protein